MSTRTNIKISVAGFAPVYLYRHCDGYPAYAGADVLRFAKTGLLRYGPAGCANRFFAELYEVSEHRKKPRPIYELTEQAHGDIEHFYEIQHTPGVSEVWIRHGAGYGPELENTAETLTREAFAEVVNADRCAINQRVEGLARKNPRYADCEPLEPVSVPAEAAL